MKRPNILFLLNDHQAYFGHDMAKRKNFEKLAREGIEFSRAYTVCPLCGPARRSMLTGLYPHNHGEVKNDVNHPYDKEVYLDILTKNGYRNFYFGKWHAGGGTAKDFGCEGFCYPSYSNPYTKPEYKEYLKRYNLPEPEVMIEHNFWRHDEMKPGVMYKQDKDWCNEHGVGYMTTPKETHEAFFLANLACEKLNEIKNSCDDTPFSIRVDFWGPHQPYFPTPEYLDMYPPDKIERYPTFDSDNSDKPYVYGYEFNRGISDDDRRLIHPNPLPWENWQHILSRCYQQITLVDDAAGMIIDELDRLGFGENTIVVYTTDHGDAVACHGGHFDKSSYMIEETLKIPLAIRQKGKIEAGQKSEALVSNMDVPVTLLSAAGLSFNEKVDGKDLLPIAYKEKTKVRDALMCETYGHPKPYFARTLYDGDLKYTYNRGEKCELYDIKNDPYQKENHIDDLVFKENLRDMVVKLDMLRAELNDKEELEGYFEKLP